MPRLEQQAGRLSNLFCGDAEMLVDGLARGRGTEIAHADKGGARAEPAVPAEAYGGLDSDPRRRAEHGVPVILGLALEQFPARHRYDRGGDPVLRQRLA